MEGAVLQDMLWGVWACLTRAVRCGRQPQAIQVGTQSAVPSAQPKDHNPLVTLEAMYSDLFTPPTFSQGQFW